MKVLVAIVLGIVLAPCMVQACGCAYPGYRSDPESCCRYLVCDNCIEKTMTCPNGLHWNNKTQACDWPCNAGCAGGEGGEVAPPVEPTTEPTTEPPTTVPTTEPTTTEIPTQPPPTTEPPSTCCPGSCCECDEGQYTSGSECCKFRVCEAGKYVELKCPAGLHWNNKTKACDWPCNAGCANITGPNPPVITPPPVVTPPGTGNPGCGECVCGTFSPVDGEACKYKVCDNGCWTTMKCPAGLIWNQNATACAWGNCQHCESSK
ncbi:peritrophin-1-like [Hermetia illucens]|nr:peritrophin-1-like [Hermetia illucens]